VLLNLAALYSRAAHLHSVPYRDLLGSMALFGFFLGALNLVLEVRHHDRSLGPFLEPAALLLLVAALLLPHHSIPPKPELRGSIFALHVTLNMLAYAAFAVACALSALYLVVRRSLKSGAALGLEGPASRLPSLSYLERANKTSLTVGVAALTVGLALGMFWASRVWKPTDPHWATDPKVAVAVLTLVFYVVIVVRALRGAAPVSTAKLSVAAFLLVIVSYTAINLLFSRLHAFVS
jgi:ABC-type transport system involved in cytochrome c biogenesis permease subunit